MFAALGFSMSELLVAALFYILIFAFGFFLAHLSVCMPIFQFLQSMSFEHTVLQATNHKHTMTADLFTLAVRLALFVYLCIVHPCVLVLT